MSKKNINGGYGFVSKEVVSDPSITPRAKGLYAYFAVIAGIEQCTLSTTKVCEEMAITKDELSKCINELVSAGVVERGQFTKDGLLEPKSK